MQQLMPSLALKFLNVLKSRITTRNTKPLKTIYHKDIELLVQKLYTLGFIMNYYVDKDNNFILIKYKNLKLLSGLVYYARKDRARIFKYEDLSRLSAKGKTICFQTSNGIYTLEECLQSHIGGRLYFSL